MGIFFGLPRPSFFCADDRRKPFYMKKFLSYATPSSCSGLPDGTLKVMNVTNLRKKCDIYVVF